MCAQAPGISRILFADDTLLFFRANREEDAQVKEALGTYARATGQLINPAKCYILFGPKCSQANKQEVMHQLDVMNMSFEEKYLGFPTPSGRFSKGKLHNLQQPNDQENYSVGGIDVPSSTWGAY